MKKFTIFTIMFALVFSLSAQITRAPQGALIKASELGLKSKSLHEIKQNKNFENWLWLADIGINIAGGDEGFFTTYSQPIWPDSTVVTIGSDGSNPVWMHSIAAIFDARSQAYEEYLDYQLVEDYEPYVVHAIMVPAWYDFRNGQFDKLRIEVGAANIENESAFTGVMLGEDITFASMNVSVQMPNNGKSLRDGDNIAALPVEHTGPWKGSFPTGFTSNITGNDYAASNEGAARFDTEGNHIIVEFDSEAEELECRLKGMVGSGTWAGTFSVNESANGTDWTTLGTTITELSTTDFSDYTYNLSSDARFVKFNFDNKVSGNVGLSKIAISKATATPVEYAVTFEVEGDNGTIAATVDGNDITSGEDIEENKEVVFTANPADGFQVKEWTINGNVVTDNTTNSLNVTVTEAITVKVEFEAESTTPPAEFAVTFEVEGDNGTITATVEGNDITSGEDIEENKEVVFTANPADGFQVKEWTINGDVVEDNATNSLNVTVTEAILVKVEFEAETTTPPAEYAVTFEVEGDNGTITATVEGNDITSGDDVEENKEVVFTANPADGFQVKEWTINGDVVEDNATNSLNVTVTEAILVKVEFEAETETPVEYAVTFAVEGDNGAIVATVDETEIDSGDLVEANKDVVFTATPEDGFQVKEWTINGDVVADNTTNTLNVTVTEEITVKVEFEAETETPVEYAVTFAVEGDNGAIVATVDETEIDSGDLVEANKEVVFTATPEEGYIVKEWTINGDVVADNTTNTLNVTVTEEITVKVEFEAEEEEEVLTRPVAEWSYSEKIVFDYVLTAEDVMSEEGYAQEIVIELPQPITVQPGEVLGFNLTFIPTAEYETGDTLQVYGGETPNKLNSFLFFYLSDDAEEPSFHDPLGFNIFQFTHMYTLYQTFDNQLLNQIFYPDVWGSALIGFYAEQIVGIEEADNSSISVYPNPAESVVNVKLNSNETAKISIINIVGQTVQTVSTNMTQNTFDVSNLDAGIYLVRVEQSGIVYTKKVVVK